MKALALVQFCAVIVLLFIGLHLQKQADRGNDLRELIVYCNQHGPFDGCMDAGLDALP